MKFYSDVLDTMFDSVEDLQAAEKQAAEAEAKKKKASETKKAEAKKVEEAFKALNAAKRKYNTNVLDLKKKYNEDLAVLREKLNELRKVHENAVAAEAAARDEAAVAFDTALKEFTDKHGSYHMTLRDGDHVLTLSNQSSSKMEIIDPFADSMKFLEAMIDMFKS